MEKSKFVEGLDVVQAQANHFLAPLGFKKKGRTHNRFTKGNLIHVINFQKDKYAGVESGISWFRKCKYGKFAVNLGVLFPCVFQVEEQTLPGNFVQEYDCTMRQRLGLLAFKTDKWFEITNDTSGLAKTVIDLLHRFGLPFLEQFQTYEDALLFYRKHDNLPLQNPRRASLEAALISHHIGDDVSAQSLFQKAFAVNHQGFQRHVAELAKRVGFELTPSDGTFHRDR